MSEKLYNQTEMLLQYNHRFLQIYENARNTGEKKDFHKEIKLFVDEVKKENIEWNKLIKSWLAENTPKYIHFQQIDNISEQIEQQSIQAFFPETSKSRFLNTNRTIAYFLENVLKELQFKERDA